MKFSQPQSVMLDLLRGLSAQLVLVGHALGSAEIQNPKFLIQNFGVAVFFILSGLLVTSSVLNKPATYGFREYLIDRAARIFVPYVPAVAFIVLTTMVWLRGPTDAFTVLANLLMLEDFPLFRFVRWFPEIDRVGTGRPLWSVAMEWWFYMAAAAVFFFRRLPWWSWTLLLPGLFVMSFNLTIGMLGFVWIAGAALAAIFFRLPSSGALFWVLGSLALAIVTAYRLRLVSGDFYDLQFALLTTLTLACGLKAVAETQWLVWLERPAAGLAAFSYTLYLTHYTVMQLFASFEGWTRVAVVFVAANALAAVMWWLFERHHRKVARWLRSLLTTEKFESRGGS